MARYLLTYQQESEAIGERRKIPKILYYLAQEDELDKDVQNAYSRFDATNACFPGPGSRYLPDHHLLQDSLV